MSSTRRAALLALAVLAFVPGAAPAEDKSIVVASTTSTQDSGLFGHILPLFKSKTGIDAKVLAQGTGQALDTGRRGNADVVFVHAKEQEEKFLADGYGVKRYPVMYNDFILVGPGSDPAGIKGTADVVVALNAIKANREMKAMLGAETDLPSLTDEKAIRVIDEWRKLHPPRSASGESGVVVREWELR